MTLFTDIARLHTFSSLAEKQGRKPQIEDLQAIENAAILVSAGGIIEWVGAKSDVKAALQALPRKKKASRVRKVSLKGAVVLPAFTECHTHLLYAGSRAEEFERRNRGDSYLSIAEAGGGIRSTVLATAKARDKDLVSEMESRLQEFARQGVTTVEIKTGYAATIEEEQRHLKILNALKNRVAKSLPTKKFPRVVITCLAAHSIPQGETEASWLAKVETLLPRLRRMGARLDIFIEKSAFSLEGARELLKKARAEGLDVAIHADQLSRSGGTELGVELGARSVDHVIEVGEKEIAQLARATTVAVLLPAADLYTRLSYPKARQMIDSGVRVALATDHNPGTSPGLDLALVGVLARTCMQMTLPEIFAAYTVNAAAALGLENEIGALTKGRRADFLVLHSGAGLWDLFYEIGPKRSHAAIASVWRDGVQMAR